MIKEVIQYSDLLELLLVIFILLCFVIYIFLYFFFKRVEKKIAILNKIALEYKDKALANNNFSNNKFEEIQKISLDLKLKYKETQEYIIVNNENSYKKFEYLAKELFNLQNQGNENIKLLNIINRKIHNKSKKDNVQ